MVSSILLVCCNLPVETDPTEQLEGLVYTAAAQTIMAQYSQSAETSEPIEEPSISPNPTATDTSTLTLTATGTPTPTETRYWKSSMNLLKMGMLALLLETGWVELAWM